MKKVLVTRPQAQQQLLLDRLAEEGFQGISLPLLEIVPFTAATAPHQCAMIDEQISHLTDFQHIVFVSTNAVHCAWPWISQQWPDLPHQLHWYAIGAATAAALASCGVHAIEHGVRMDSESLLAHPQLQQVQGHNVLICRGMGGRDYLRQVLSERGARVIYCELYQRRGVRYSEGTLAEVLRQGVDFLQLNSAETIQALLEQAIIDNVKQALQDVTVIVPGTRLYQYARDCGFTSVIASRNAGLEAIMDALQA